MNHYVFHKEACSGSDELFHVAPASPIVLAHRHAHVGVSVGGVAAALDFGYLTSYLEVLKLQLLDGQYLLELVDRFLINFVTVQIFLVFESFLLLAKLSFTYICERMVPKMLASLIFQRLHILDCLLLGTYKALVINTSNDFLIGSEFFLHLQVDLAFEHVRSS